MDLVRFMRPGVRKTRVDRVTIQAKFFLMLLLFVPVLSATELLAQPTFSKTFLPSTIGPGSVSTLRFDITNNDASPVTDLAFTDVLPAGVVIATPAGASTTCGGAFTLSAPDGGGTITFSGGSVAANTTCSIFVNVTSTTPGTHTNHSDPLTSSAGSSGAATADLTVDEDRPGFSKSFSPSSIPLGSRSTLTFTIDNQSEANSVFNLAFTDGLPAGVVIADPANAATTCSEVDLTADPGTGTIVVSPATSAFAALAILSSCTVSVDVVGTAVGQFNNLSGELTSTTSSFGPTRSSGKATAALAVTAEDVHLTKEFTDDPVLAGGTVTLEFTIQNRDRDLSATGIAFTDNLDATLSGLQAIGPLPTNPCGAGSTLSGTGLLSLSGGSLAPEESCTFSVTLQIPAGAAPGDFPNVTTAVSGTLGGSPFSGNQASDTLFVNEGPTLTKAFAVSTAGTDETVTLNFTITNNSSTSAATDIAFNDNFGAFLGADVTFTSLPPDGFCGVGSLITSILIGGERTLVITGGSLTAGASCSFSVEFIVPLGVVGGSHVNTTTNITATVDGATQVGNQASDTLEIVSAPLLSKEFTDDPVLPGDTVTLQFTLSHGSQASSDATAIAFTDDLDAALSGLTAVGLPPGDICGTGSTLSGVSTLSFTGGSLVPGASCTFSVTLQVPGGAAPGSHTNTTSDVTATVGGVAATGGPAGNDLQIAALTFSKTFSDDPVIPGDTVTLQFAISNVTAASNATDITFIDNLGAVLSGLQATGPLPTNPCGAGSTLSGTSTLALTGGNLGPGSSCTFDVTVAVPGGASDGDFLNSTSELTATIDGTPNLNFPAASDVLTVSSEVLEFTKTFTDDPVAPGGTVTLEFTITNTAADLVTDVTFTDDLDAALAGLSPVGLPLNDVCGTGSVLSNSGSLTLTGGNIPAGSSCTFSVTLQVPAGAAASTVTNTTSPVSGTINGLPVDGPAASDALQIAVLTFDKRFTDDPVFPGETVTLEFTITSTGAAGASGLTFTDDLSTVIPGLAAIGLPAQNVCGAGSELSGATLLTFRDGSIGAGGSCTVSVTLQVPSAASPGVFSNATSDLTGSLNPVTQVAFATTAQTAPVAVAAQDDLNVADPEILQFTKSFTDDPVMPGDTVTLEFTITNPDDDAVVGVTFTDDLDAALTDLAAVGLPLADVCGAGSQITGTGVLSLTGGTIAGGSSCTFSVTLQVPSDAPPSAVANTTSPVSGTINSATVTGPAASDDLQVGVLSFSKEFTDDPVMGGETVTLEFTIASLGGNVGASDLTFTDDLDAVVSGLAATGLPAPDVCGSGSEISGTTLLTLTGGTIAPGEPCTFSVTLQVPANATPGVFPNSTSDLNGILQVDAGQVALFNSVGGPVAMPAEDDLVIEGAEPGPVQIPTLSQWALLFLAAGLLLFGLRRAGA